MSEIKWIKLSTNIFDDEKIKLIDGMPERDTILVVLFKIFALAGKCNDVGNLVFSNKIAYTDEMLSTIFNRPLNSVRLALTILVEYDIIEILNKNEHKIYCVKNWSKYQNIDGMEKAKELNRQRVTNYREKQKILALGSDRIEQEIYELYKKGHSLRDIGEKFNMSKNTVARIIKKIENLLKESNEYKQCDCDNEEPENYTNTSKDTSGIDKQEDVICDIINNLNNESDKVESSLLDCPESVTQLSQKCPTIVPKVSHDCPSVVPKVSHGGTKIDQKTVPNFVPRDSANVDKSDNRGCNVTSNVLVTLRNAYKNKNIDIDLDKDKDLDINTNTEEEDMRIGENRLCAKTENKIIFNKETNTFDIPENVLAFLKSAYPDIELEAKLSEMSLWLMAHPETVEDIAKHDNNFIRFVIKWLSNEKNKPKKLKPKTYSISFDEEIANFTGLTEKYISIMKSKFQAVDIDSEIRKMESWLLNNPKKRPAKDYMRFINNWLTHEQNKIAMRASGRQNDAKTFADIRREKNLQVAKEVIEEMRSGKFVV